MSRSGSKAESLRRIGRLKQPHGLRGEIAVEPVGDFTDLVRAGASLWIRRPEETAEQAVTVESARKNGTHLLVKFLGRSDLESLQSITGADLLIDRGELVRPSPDFLFDDEVEGFSCVSRDGGSLGIAKGFERLGSSRFLIVEHGGKSSLVPFVYPIVAQISRSDRRLVLDPPEGLLEL